VHCERHYDKFKTAKFTSFYCTVLVFLHIFLKEMFASGNLVCFMQSDTVTYSSLGLKKVYAKHLYNLNKIKLIFVIFQHTVF